MNYKFGIFCNLSIKYYKVSFILAIVISVPLLPIPALFLNNKYIPAMNYQIFFFRNNIIIIYQVDKKANYHLKVSNDLAKILAEKY